MAWLYNSRTGVIAWFPPGPVELFELKSGLGWHGPFDTQQQAMDYYNQNKVSNPGWSAPTGSPVTALNNGVNSVEDQAIGAVTPQWLKGINWSVLMLQIGEIVLGIVLIGIGVAHLTGNSNAISSLAKAAV